MGRYQIFYEGNLRTKCVHLGNNQVIYTDAPKDNMGKGEQFSPTDLLAVSLASCILTIMGIQADKLGISLTGTTAQVEKEMVGTPRRIGRVKISIVGPKIPEEAQKKLEQAGHQCPVSKSLHPDLKQDITFTWVDSK